MDSDQIALVSLGTLAAQHPEWISVFERFRLDYCCHGNHTLTEACNHAGIPLSLVLDAITKHAPAGGTHDQPDWLCATMTALADHIESTHHAFARSAFSRLATLLPRVSAAHGAAHTWLTALATTLADLSDAMHDHMVREERVLFPWLRRLDTPSQIHSGPPWSVRRPISCMVHDHDEVSHGFTTIRSLTSDYVAPSDACASFHAMLALLRQLETDTKLHIHKENNILFPAGVRAEQLQSARSVARANVDTPLA